MYSHCTTSGVRTWSQCTHIAGSFIVRSRLSTEMSEPVSQRREWWCGKLGKHWNVQFKMSIGRTSGPCLVSAAGNLDFTRITHFEKKFWANYSHDIFVAANGQIALCCHGNILLYPLNWSVCHVTSYRRTRRTWRTQRNICPSTWSVTSRLTCLLTSSRRCRTSTGRRLGNWTGFKWDCGEFTRLDFYDKYLCLPKCPVHNLSS